MALHLQSIFFHDSTTDEVHKSFLMKGVPKLMKITEVKIFPVQEDKLKAYVTITLNDCFIIRDLKVIQGKSGMFVAMPSKKTRDGSFKDIAHPLNSDTRQQMEDLILEAYEASLKDQKKSEETKISQLGVDN